MFSPARASDIVTNLLNAVAGLDSRATDLNPGSVLRTIMEAVAVVQEELQHKAFQGIVEGIAEELYTAFDFTRLPGVPASGLVRFWRKPGTTGSLLVPQGTVVASPPTAVKPEVQYTTGADATIQAGQDTVDVTATATEVGTIGNAAAGAISVLRSVVTDVSAVSNPGALLSGQDEESDSDRRQRFAKWVSNLRGATAAGLEANAESVVLTDGQGNPIERVDKARAVDSSISGRVDVYIDNGGGDASPTLISTVQQTLDGSYDQGGNRVIGYKAAGIVVRVFGTTGVAVPVTGTLTIEDGYSFSDVNSAAVQAVQDYIQAIGVFSELILADLIATIVGVEGVKDVSLSDPTANRTADFSERLIPGTISFTEAA